MDEFRQVRKPGQISKGKRSWERRRCKRKTGILAFPVTDPTHNQPLWLVIVRRKGQPPWYLLTSEPAYSSDLAWQITLAYARRWQVELAFESPRLLKWQQRHKLLLMAALAYAFLLSLLKPTFSPLRSWLMRTFCHRTGKRSRVTPAPLYRLHIALSFLWLTHPPPFFSYL